MKNSVFKLLILFVFISFFVSCTIQKRRYSSGYHVTWHHSKKNKSIHRETSLPKTKALLVHSEESVLDIDLFKSNYPNTEFGNQKLTAPNLKEPHAKTFLNLTTTHPLEFKKSLGSHDLNNQKDKDQASDKDDSKKIRFILGLISTAIGVFMVDQATPYGDAGTFLLGISFAILGVILLISSIRIQKKTTNNLIASNQSTSGLSKQRNGIPSIIIGGVLIISGVIMTATVPFAGILGIPMVIAGLIILIQGLVRYAKYKKSEKS